MAYAAFATAWESAGGAFGGFAGGFIGESLIAIGLLPVLLGAILADPCPRTLIWLQLWERSFF